ncbi:MULTISPECIES: nicotinamide riboside transporter PnuC [Aerococcus]|uniref:Nicotinamide mononucleotide transporter n=1 Tax=Aerococcus tenax TaxID=3078812 RepID=A0A5N1BI20_9LACT|nr:nicotinamide riboside transporter PnuC [Aerococcus urinae]KAA9239748.1 nicotinamide mononucleotide transporter [Aerococcus urinae]MDK6370597.1 nicotinamide riboside transporter PnuC [Aerococcus urinae]MDK6596731.1 nicotinamide riboside transporter PnuC [Aerococcus urinae]MDK7302195.1 nicotinamide riboside transporter PnuC [Aerococcus urinae]MDK7800854.1 nicotinamide riboside transporter PnuC [Aerococcus urinae]
MQEQNKATKTLSLKECIHRALKPLNKVELTIIAFGFIVSLGFNLYGIITSLTSQEFDLNILMSLGMSIFGFLGTWTLAIQWQPTFIVNGIQNIFGIAAAAILGIYGDMFSSIYYLITEFVGHFSWSKRRDENGDLHVDQYFNLKIICQAVFFWTIGLGAFSYVLGGQQIVLDAITNGISFTAQQRQVTGHKDGYYLWLINDILSVILWLQAGNLIVGFSYLGMLAQGIAGLIIWSKGKSSALEYENECID